jgi:hypothetical protein
VVRGYLRTDPEFAGASRLGRYAECSACQQEVSCSLSGMALAHPQARAYRRQHPRLRAVPMHHTSVASRPALVVGYREVGGSGGFDVVFDEATLDVVGVHPAG